MESLPIKALIPASWAFLARIKLVSCISDTPFARRLQSLTWPGRRSCRKRRHSRFHSPAVSAPACHTAARPAARLRRHAPRLYRHTARATREAADPDLCRRRDTGRRGGGGRRTWEGRRSACRVRWVAGRRRGVPGRRGLKRGRCARWRPGQRRLDGVSVVRDQKDASYRADGSS